MDASSPQSDTGQCISFGDKVMEGLTLVGIYLEGGMLLCESGVGIFYPNFSDFLLPWPKRPITVDNETVDL
jgi:hypothetical protein